MQVALVEHVPDVSKTAGLDVTTIETRTLKKVIIIDESRQEETRVSKIKLDQRAPPSVREEGDDWFILLDAICKKPVVIPPGTLHQQMFCCLSPANSPLPLLKYLMWCVTA